MRGIIKKVISLTSAVSIGVTVLAACAGQNDTGKSVRNMKKDEVVIAIDTEPENGFDPTKGWGHGTTPLIQSTLLSYTKDMQVVNDLATEYETSKDGLTWTFRLRKDAFFTDGEPVRAEDVAFTFQQAKAGQTFLDLSNMASCSVTGEDSVTFTLNKPASTFVYTIATIGIVPKHAYDENYAKNPIGSGPFKFVQWNQGEQVILEANEKYYGEIPAIKRAVLLFMDEDAAYAAAKSGQIDAALTSAAYASHKIEGMRIEAVTTMDNRGITLPMSKNTGERSQSGQPVGNDVTAQLSIRQAMAYGIDRERIAEEAVDGFATPAYSENDGMPWNNPEGKIETNVEFAKKILREDGWSDTDGDGVIEKDGQKAEFVCVYPSGDSVRQAVAMAAAEQLLKIGIRMNIEGTSWDDISRRMFTDAVLMGWGSVNPDTSYLLYHSSNALNDDYYNPEGLLDPTVDGYLDAAMSSVSPEEAVKKWQMAQWDGSTGTSMKGLCPFVWLVNIKHIYFVRDGLNIGEQKLHAHGAGWSLVQNLRDWSWN